MYMYMGMEMVPDTNMDKDLDTDMGLYIETDAIRNCPLSPNLRNETVRLAEYVE
jgi:hypothetical protein